MAIANYRHQLLAVPLYNIIITFETVIGQMRNINTLPAKDGDFRLCDGMCVFHLHMLQTTNVHIACCAIQLERRNVPHYFGIKQ